jgi:hypothetical protein
MSNALALSAVTATLQYWLSSTLNDPSASLGSVAVTAVSPDIAQPGGPTGANAELSVNVFLHQVIYNAAWRNIGYPSVSRDGASRISNPPLALDLHYLLTAYASKDTEAEALMGYAVLMLHENPVFTRQQISAALTGIAPTQPFATVLKNSGLADQFEMVKVTPSKMNTEELAWLWTALKADYRLTFPFEVSVVLIEPQFAVLGSLPVFQANLTVQAGLQPSITQISPPTAPASGVPGQVAAAPGQPLVLGGSSLSNVTQISFTNPRVGVSYTYVLQPTDTVTETSITFPVPNDAVHFPAGIYQLTAQITDSTGTVQQSSNAVLAPVAPVIDGTPTHVVNSKGMLFTVNTTPQVQPNQSVSMSIGNYAGVVQTFNAATATLQFQFATLPAGTYVARLTVDGVPSNVTWSAAIPGFTGPEVII